MEHENHEKMSKDKMTPEMCARAGKCMMKEMMDKMENTSSENEYKKMSDEEKDEADEKDVMNR